MEYPIQFKVCPCCGSDKRIIESEVNQEKSKGSMKANIKIPCMFSQVALFEPSTLIAPKTFPMITCFFDVCAECGTLYCVEAHKSQGTAQPNIRRDNFGQYPNM